MEAVYLYIVLSYIFGLGMLRAINFYDDNTHGIHWAVWVVMWLISPIKIPYSVAWWLVTHFRK